MKNKNKKKLLLDQHNYLYYKKLVNLKNYKIKPHNYNKIIINLIIIAQIKKIQVKKK